MHAPTSSYYSPLAFVAQGQYKDPDPFATDSSLWVSAVRQGCRSSTEQATFSMLAEYGMADCYTRDTSTCRGCPSGLIQTSGCTVDKPAICDTSPHGFAGQWPSSHAIQDFQEPLQQLARCVQQHRTFTLRTRGPRHV